MITERTDLVQALLTVLRGLPGLRPATPVTRSWVPWDADTMALDVDDHTVEIRVVALALPLEPLLREAASALAPSLNDSAWRNARLRLVVTDVDRGALDSLHVPET
ncbi:MULTISPECIES: hypothetical protein [Prauserella salsuginis group]|uniref:Uncharacterized protein n=2 Tax=Prauserella salsuginis group TaxID=2893672 RepID=A0A839XTK4_9PSEU|nr:MULTISPECIES: hypothetical protein [Prauserella salsuginis group]MBB3663175.1 hypothetical protein [Prauserella sediminis]MCR3720998.1 hypothetical protein [Prauserella flava]MCR3734921.1 hypothetical protein [Prauserella salsuginis]